MGEISSQNVQLWVTRPGAIGSTDVETLIGGVTRYYPPAFTGPAQTTATNARTRINAGGGDDARGVLAVIDGKVDILANTLDSASTLTLEDASANVYLSLSIAAGQTGKLNVAPSTPVVDTPGRSMYWKIVTGGSAIQNIQIRALQWRGVIS